MDRRVHDAEVLTSVVDGELRMKATVMVLRPRRRQQRTEICGRPEWRHSQRSSRSCAGRRRWNRPTRRCRGGCLLPTPAVYARTTCHMHMDVRANTHASRRKKRSIETTLQGMNEELGWAANQKVGWIRLRNKLDKMDYLCQKLKDDKTNNGGGDRTQQEDNGGRSQDLSIGGQ
jgi:hypothetical protein